MGLGSFWMMRPTVRDGTLHDERVRAHFGARAAGYQAASERWPWDRLRESEAAVVGAVLGDLTGCEVLELGCGAGFYTRMMLARGAASVVAVDITPEMLEALPRERVLPVLGDAATIRIGRRFQRLLSAGVLEFVREPVTVLRNARAHAADGATMVVLAPNKSRLGRLYGLYHRCHGVPIHLFPPSGVAALAQTTGWRVTASRPAPPLSTVLLLEAV